MWSARFRRTASRMLRAGQLLADGPGGMMERCREQFAYGHVDILREYVSAKGDRFLAGLLPHAGWRAPTDASPGGPFRSPTGRQLPIWAWNSSWRDFYRSRGANHVEAIGAPWIYLLALEGVPPVWEWPTRTGHRGQASPAHLSGRSLYVPIHSWERDVLDLESRVDRLVGPLPPETTVVLLGWGDFLTRGTRRAYERAGYQVECNGWRGGTIAPQSPIGDRALFLRNLLHLFQKVDEVVSEDMCTALLYASSIGKNVRALPEVREISEATMCRNWSDYRVWRAGEHRPVTAEYSWIEESAPDPFAHREQIRLALGGDCMRSSLELDQILDWRAIPH